MIRPNGICHNCGGPADPGDLCCSMLCIDERIAKILEEIRRNNIQRGLIKAELADNREQDPRTN